MHRGASRKAGRQAGYLLTLTFLRCVFMLTSTEATVPCTVVPFFSSTVTVSLFIFIKNRTSFMVLDLTDFDLTAASPAPAAAAPAFLLQCSSLCCFPCLLPGGSCRCKRSDLLLLSQPRRSRCVCYDQPLQSLSCCTPLLHSLSKLENPLLPHKLVLFCCAPPHSVPF